MLWFRPLTGMSPPKGTAIYSLSSALMKRRRDTKDTEDTEQEVTGPIP